MARLTLISAIEGVDEQGWIWRWWSYVYQPAIQNFDTYIPPRSANYWRCWKRASDLGPERDRG